jgi:cytochrome c oxidase subunit 3
MAHRIVLMVNALSNKIFRINCRGYNFDPKSVRRFIGVFSNPYHFVPPRNKPVTVARFLFLTLFGIVIFAFYGKGTIFFFGLGFLVFHLLDWFIEVESESEGGCHSVTVGERLRLGAIMFIIGEVIFFVSFF